MNNLCGSEGYRVRKQVRVVDVQVRFERAVAGRGVNLCGNTV